VKSQKIPAATIIRLSVYQRYLKRLLAREVKVVSSGELALRANVNPAQLRKDLSYFGKFGKRGVGYDVTSLMNTISSILGVVDEHTIVLVGTGPIGRGLLRHSGFAQQGYRFKAVFDIDPASIGMECVEGLVVRSLDELPGLAEEYSIQLAVLAVPSDRAQEVADSLVTCGIKGILNFSPTRIRVPRGVSVQYVDFTILLDSLTYNISRARTDMEKSGQTDREIPKLKWASEHSWPVVESNIHSQGAGLNS
jgi:redox-sensing transcriptional repressor